MDIAQLEQGKKLHEKIENWKRLDDYLDKQESDDSIEVIRKLLNSNDISNLMSGIDRKSLAVFMLNSLKKNIKEELKVLEAQFEEI